MNIRKMIPAFAIAIWLVLAMATSGFKEVPKENQNPYFYDNKFHRIITINP